MPDPRSIGATHARLADLLSEIETGETGGDMARNPEILAEISRLAGGVKRRRLGPKQLRILSIIARPGCCLVNGSRVSDSLIARGMAVAYHQGRHCVGITAEGLRALGEFAERGDVELEPDFERFKNDGA